jgi:hypothetical protein
MMAVPPVATGGCAQMTALHLRQLGIKEESPSWHPMGQMPAPDCFSIYRKKNIKGAYKKVL